MPNDTDSLKKELKELIKYHKDCIEKYQLALDVISKRSVSNNVNAPNSGYKYKKYLPVVLEFFKHNQGEQSRDSIREYVSSHFNCFIHYTALQSVLNKPQFVRTRRGFYKLNEDFTHTPSNSPL